MSELSEALESEQDAHESTKSALKDLLRQHRQLQDKIEYERPLIDLLNECGYYTKGQRTALFNLLKENKSCT